MKIDAIILAGALNNNGLQSCAIEKYEALIKIGGKPMVEYVVEAVNGAHLLDKKILIGPIEDLNYLKKDVEFLISSGETMIDSICAGLNICQDSDYILIVTSDIPLIRSFMIDDFIKQSLGTGQSEIYYPIVSKECNESKYPGVERTYVKLNAQEFTGGNLALIKPAIIDDLLTMFTKMITWRKKPWKLSQLLGVKMVWKYFFGQLQLNDVEQRFSEVVNHQAKAVKINYPEIGIDIDKKSDLNLIKAAI